MAKAQRDRGKRGEREVARLIYDELGFEAKRRVRQRDGDSDVDGVPGWAIEVKNHSTVTRAGLREWWQQAVEQASANVKPVLIYRRGRGWWRCIWGGPEWAYTTEGEVEAWASAVREQL